MSCTTLSSARTPPRRRARSTPTPVSPPRARRAARRRPSWRSTGARRRSSRCCAHAARGSMCSRRPRPATWTGSARCSIPIRRCATLTPATAGRRCRASAAGLRRAAGRAQPRGPDAGRSGARGGARGAGRWARGRRTWEDAMRKVALVGAGVSKFGVRKASYRDLVWEAGKACFDSIPGVKPKDIEGLVVGSVMPERTAFQSHISSMAAEALGIRPTALSARTEHMCASGTVGIRYAYAFIAAGLADLVMVLGVEKLNQPSGDEAILNMGTGVDREWEAAFGLTAPPCFALAAQRHMADYGTTEEHLAHWPAMQRAAASAYKAAGVAARDVDVAEVHDCFAIAELIAYEELGFCAKGEAGPFVAAGRSDYGGDVVVNPRGGLIGCGHPLGATGVAQAAEVFAQLRGEAGARQVPDAEIGLTHNNSGMGEHIVMIYGREWA